MALDGALRAADPLASDAPQQPFALVTVSRVSRCPRREVVWRRTTDGVDQGLKRFFVNMHFLEHN